MHNFYFILFMFFSIQTFAQDKTYVSENQKFKLEVVYQGEDVIWGFDFINNNEIIFTERSGKLVTLNLANNKKTQINGLPAIAVDGQGGLLDVRVITKDKTSRVYLSYSASVNKMMTTMIGVGDLINFDLKNFTKLFQAFNENAKDIHFGSRITFDDNGHMFFTVGDRNERDKAQSLEYHNGKIIRISLDGTIPKDNPFHDDNTAKKEIWSYGHRNPQGLVFNKKTKELWSSEFGPRGGDEINLIEKGKNYGWPIVTYGKEYWGPSIGEGTSKVGMEPPRKHYLPSISPSGMDFYFGEEFPQWNGNLFIGCLSGTKLERLVIEKGVVTKNESLLEDLGWRIRNVRQAPSNGNIYFSTDDGKIVKIVKIN